MRAPAIECGAAIVRRVRAGSTEAAPAMAQAAWGNSVEDSDEQQSQRRAQDEGDAGPPPLHALSRWTVMHAVAGLIAQRISGQVDKRGGVHAVLLKVAATAAGQARTPISRVANGRHSMGC